MREAQIVAENRTKAKLNVDMFNAKRKKRKKKKISKSKSEETSSSRVRKRCWETAALLYLAVLLKISLILLNPPQLVPESHGLSNDL